MPFKRPTLTELRELNKNYIETQLDSVGKLLRQSNMRVLADVQAGMSHLHYGYLDYIALQATPATATDEYLAAWGALKGIYRKSATPAICPKVKFTGQSGAEILKVALLSRNDGYQYRLDEDVLIENGEGIGSVTAVLTDPTEDPSGGGVKSNAPIGTTLTIDATPLNIDSKATMLVAATGGADIESESSFRDRVLYAYQNPPQGGAESDYIQWAKQVPGVTRAWVARRVMGAGTVGVYIMCDTSENNEDGFPSGDDGVSSNETWGSIKATGNQVEVADYIYDLQPVTALVFVCSPVRREIDFEFEGLDKITKETAKKMRDAINSVFFDVDRLDGEEIILLSDINYAISNVAGASGYIMTTPNSNIQLTVGELPVIGIFPEGRNE